MLTQRNVKGEPFDFLRWRSWLAEKAEDLQNAGFRTKLGVNDDGSKPSCAISLENGRLGGYFSSWVSGEVDFEVLDLGSRQSIIDKMGLIVNDSTFSQTFEEFAAALKC